MEAMASMKDNEFDLAIVDPPYGINWMSQIKNPNVKANWKQYKQKNWDSTIPTKEYFEQLFRVSKEQIIWGANYMVENLYSSSCWVIWDKKQEFSGAVFEMAWTSFKSPAKAFRLSRVEAYTNKIKIHPTQKPVALYTWLLDKYAQKGWKILDTHLGSGSSAIAAHDMGYEFHGYELDEEYYEAASKRLKEHQKQLQLF
jgi:site-specific DNA-methyltransferase (adenine-specific)